jgi:hypothetical protein
MIGAMESRARQVTLVPPPDGRQSETALAIARGTARLLRSLGFSCISELPLPSGRRADLVALNERGEIWIVEIKSSIDDLRADQKWQDYRAHCDRLFFAFTQDMPCEIFPAQTGLIVADAYGAHLHCEAPEHRLPAPTRKQMIVRFAMAAAWSIRRATASSRGYGGPGAFAVTSELSPQPFFDLLPLPITVQEWHLIEHAQSVEQQAQAPAQRGPGDPEIMRRRKVVHHRQEADNDAVLGEVNIKAF